MNLTYLIIGLAALVGLTILSTLVTVALVVLWETSPILCLLFIVVLLGGIRISMRGE